MFPSPKFSKTSTGYLFEWDEFPIWISVKRLRESSRYEVSGDIEVYHGKEQLEQTRLNLSSAQTRFSLAKILTAKVNSIDWPSALQYAAVLSMRDFRLGEPVVEVLPSDKPLVPEYLINPLVYLTHSSVMFGEKGSGKSLLALALGRLVQDPLAENHLGLVTRKEPTPTLYIDYEDDLATFEARWSALGRGFGGGAIPIYYQRLYSPLADNIELLQERIARYRIGFLLIDSLGLAAGGNLIEAEPAIKYHSTLRLLSRPSFTLAHTAKDFNLKRRSIFGSVYFTNLARSVWEIKAEAEAEANELIISVRQTDANYSAKHPAMGFRFSFAGDTIKVQRQDLAETTLSGELPLRWQITNLLKRGSLTKEEIAEQLDKPGGTIKKALQRLKQGDTLVMLDDKTWGLKLK